MSGFGCFGGSLDQSTTCETDQDGGGSPAGLRLGHEW